MREMRITVDGDLYAEIKKWMDSKQSEPSYYWDNYHYARLNITMMLDSESIAERSLAMDSILMTPDPDYFMMDVGFRMENAEAQYRSDEYRELEFVYNTLSDYNNELLAYARTVFKSGRGEHFEDGMESDFSKGIESFILKYHVCAVGYIKNQMFMGKEQPEYLVAEAMLWVGDLEDRRTEVARRDLLETAVFNGDSVRIQDAAVSGISYMGSWQSIGHLETLKKNCHESHDSALLTNINNVLKYAYKLRDKHEGMPR